MTESRSISFWSAILASPRWWKGENQDQAQAGRGTERCFADVVPVFSIDTVILAMPGYELVFGAEREARLHSEGAAEVAYNMRLREPLVPSLHLLPPLSE